MSASIYILGYIIGVIFWFRDMILFAVISTILLTALIATLTYFWAKE